MFKATFAKRPILFPLLFLLLISLNACANGITPVNLLPTPTIPATPTTANPNDTLQILYHQAPTILNPHLSTGAKDWAASRITYEPLATYDKDANLLPILAADIPSVENGDLAADLRFVIWRLKPDIFWSDGQPFTADDVLFTYEYIINQDTGAASRANYTAIDTIEVVDDLTVKIHFKDVNPAWTLPFIGIPGMILPRHIFADYVGAAAKDAPANWQPVGTGPYSVIPNGFRREEVLLLGTELVETTRIIYERNPFYREGTPYFSRVELSGGGTAKEAARLVLLTGEVDYAWNLQLDAVTLSEMEQTAVTGHTIAYLTPNVERILLNRTDPNQTTESGERASLLFPHPFFGDQDASNQLVRQAFALAINRERIVQLYPGSSITPNLLALPAEYASANTSYEFDLEKAASLLDSAGWVDSDGNGFRDKNGEPMRLLIRTSNDPVRLAALNMIEDDLESIGVEVRIEALDASTIFNRTATNENNTFHFYADMQLFFEGNSSPDPGAYMGRWRSSQIPQQENQWQAGFNRERWVSPEYDALYLASTTETDPAVRAQLFMQMNELFVENVVSIPLVHRAQISGVSNTLLGIDLTPWDADVWNIQEWRLNP